MQYKLCNADLANNMYPEQFLCIILVQQSSSQELFDGVPAVVENRADGLVCLHRERYSRVIFAHEAWVEEKRERCRMEGGM